MKLLEGNVERNPLKLILPVTFGDITTKPQTTDTVHPEKSSSNFRTYFIGSAYFDL